MSGTVFRIRELVRSGRLLLSQHATRRLLANDIASADLVDGIESAELLEDYPDYHVGPAVLLLQFDYRNAPLHAVWGLEKGTSEPAVLVTAYRPDPTRWSADFRKRRT